VVFTLAAEGLERSRLESLRGIIARYPGSCRAALAIEIPESLRTVITPADSYRVAASEEMAMEVKNLFGYNAVSFE
jgi:DNA polymerase-3 subunit alpha